MAVTAGFVSEEPRKRLFAGMDAANVDLKAFTDRFYRKLCVGALKPVQDTLKYLINETTWRFHVSSEPGFRAPSCALWCVPLTTKATKGHEVGRERLGRGRAALTDSTRPTPLAGRRRR